jgi:hypothetical protein
VIDATRPSAGDVPSPDQREVPDPGRRSYDAMQVFQSLIELQKDVTSISIKTERLITDSSKLDQKVDALSQAFASAKGFGIAAIILIPICAGFVWWLIGDKLNHIRDDLVNRPAISEPFITPHR